MIIPHPRVDPALVARACCVCGTPYEKGSRIVYNGGSKKAAHLGCGQADARGGA